MELLLSILIGLGLSAACGFRVFVPLLIVSLGAHTGHLALTPAFAWAGTTPALIAFAVATVVELLGYMVPWLDHLLDAAALPMAAIAGTILTAGMIADASPWLRWSLAIVAGGGIAAGTRATMALVRTGFTATTGGIANPIFSLLESLSSFAAAVLALLAPLIGLAVAAAVVLVLLRVRRKMRKTIAANLGDTV